MVCTTLYLDMKALKSLITIFLAGHPILSIYEKLYSRIVLKVLCEFTECTITSLGFVMDRTLFKRISIRTVLG